MIRIRRIAAHNFKQLQEVELHLPEQGRFLIQGRNEAGKSTFFEAVFFGIFGLPLVTEMGTRRLDDLIRYGVEKARVELWLEAPDRLYKIYRTIVRGKPNVWELDIEGPNGVEEVRGNDPVNRRIVQELGFDGEALLNTCFVEQKKLEKLEGMSRAQREESLMKLLNLEAMVDMVRDFKVRGEDRLTLERCEQRHELAQIQAELPAREKELAEIKGKLIFIDLQKMTEATVQERRAVQGLEEEMVSLAAQRDSLAAEVERVDRLKEGMQALREIRGYLERVDEQRREIKRLERELEEGERLRRQELPALQGRLRSLRLLKSRLERLAQVTSLVEEKEAQARSLLQKLVDLGTRREQLERERKRLAEIAATIVREEPRLKALAGAVRDIERRGALQKWLEAQGKTQVPAQLEETLRQKQGERARLSQRFKIGVFGFVAAFFLSVVTVFGFVATFSMWKIPYQALLAFATTFLLLAVILVASLAWRLWSLWRELGQAAEEVGGLEGERRVLEAAAGRDQERLVAAEERLRQLGTAPPTTVEEGERLLEGLREEIGDRTLDKARAEHAEALESLAQARALRDEAERGIDKLEDELAAYDEEAWREEESICRRAVEKGRRIISRWEAKAAELAEGLAVEANLSAVQELLGGLSVKAHGMRQQVEGMAEIKAETASRQERIDGFWSKVEGLYQSIVAIAPQAPPWSADLTNEDYQAVEKRLGDEYQALGGESARHELERVQAEINSKEGEKRSRAQNARQWLEEVRGSLAALELESALSEGEPLLPELEGLLARLQSLDLGDEAALQKERDELRERVGYLRNQRSALEESLGLKGEILDADECRQALEDKRRELAVRERAVQIVETARRRVVERILPSTMEHMRQLLPPLTMHRYYDAELTEDYRIRVWDERAGDHGDWKEKNIFSGGTKDQFSLALRLAFALATLPAELGAAPSFIFLDEPLGSFDDERAKALLYLLTEGQIADSFDQIFLISHVRVNPNLFNYHLVIDGGRVVESDLPSP